MAGDAFICSGKAHAAQGCEINHHWPDHLIPSPASHPQIITFQQYLDPRVVGESEYWGNWGWTRILTGQRATSTNLIRGLSMLTPAKEWAS